MNSADYKKKFYDLMGNKELLMSRLNDGYFVPDEWQQVIEEMRGNGMYSMANEMQERMDHYQQEWQPKEQSEAEYNIIKRSLFAASEISREFSLGDANAVIGESVRDALEQMDDGEQGIVEREAKHLQDCIPGLGATGALELLASLSEFVGREK